MRATPTKISAAMAPRLSKGSKAVRHLQHLFMTGAIDGSEDPKTVYEAHTVFQQHKLANFRICYNNLKKEFAATHQESLEQDEDGLNRKCTVEEEGQLAKRRKVNNGASAIQDLEELETTLDSKTDSLTFTPLYLISKWIEPGSMRKRMTVAIGRPSGIGAGDFSFRVLEGGETLELTISWPRALLDTSVMHKKWLSDEKAGRIGSIEKYHPKISWIRGSVTRSANAM